MEKEELIKYIKEGFQVLHYPKGWKDVTEKEAIEIAYKILHHPTRKFTSKGAIKEYLICCCGLVVKEKKS